MKLKPIHLVGDEGLVCGAKTTTRQTTDATSTTCKKCRAFIKAAKEKHEDSHHPE